MIAVFQHCLPLPFPLKGGSRNYVELIFALFSCVLL